MDEQTRFQLCSLGDDGALGGMCGGGEASGHPGLKSARWMYRYIDTIEILKSIRIWGENRMVVNSWEAIKQSCFESFFSFFVKRSVPFANGSRKTTVSSVHIKGLNNFFPMEQKMYALVEAWSGGLECFNCHCALHCVLNRALSLSINPFRWKKKSDSIHGRETRYFLCGWSHTFPFFSHFSSGLHCAEPFFFLTPFRSHSVLHLPFSPSWFLPCLLSLFPCDWCISVVSPVEKLCNAWLV